MIKIKEFISKIASRENRWIFISVLIAGIILGSFFSSSNNNNPKSSKDKKSAHAIHDHNKDQIWTCSMHPQIRSNEPGKCPICGMDLIPVNSSKEEVAYNQLKLSETAIKLAEIRTSKVERKTAAKVIRLSGKVEYNETNVANLTSRIPGRIDNIYVNYTGTEIKKGNRMVNLYSPELITAQQELLQSLKSYKNAPTEQLKKVAYDTVKASREKLILWGLTKKQIKEFENRGKTVHHIVIYSPMDGIVIEKKAFEGMYVKTGTKLYTIADLSDLWVKLDAYESEISWIRLGQTVEFETESYPGEIFSGKISFIDPVINPKTRTVKVRVNVKNQGGKLKPDMFVRAKVFAKTGRFMSNGESVPLVIPSTAPLVTGKRAVVYVKVKGKAGVFEGRNVLLGPLSNGYYIVRKGLAEGEEVVVNGAFKIDSDLQIQAKPSMMNPTGGGPAPVHNHGSSGVKQIGEKTGHSKSLTDLKIPGKFRESVDNLAGIYFLIKENLSSDKFTEAKISGKDFLKNLKKVNMKLLSGTSHILWMNTGDKLNKTFTDFITREDIESARDSFAALSDSVKEMLIKFGTGNQKIFLFHCPMALGGKGAYWMQKDKETRNPFFGSKMISCQDSVEELKQEKK